MKNRYVAVLLATLSLYGCRPYYQEPTGTFINSGASLEEKFRDDQDFDGPEFALVFRPDRHYRAFPPIVLNVARLEIVEDSALIGGLDDDEDQDVIAAKNMGRTVVDSLNALLNERVLPRAGQSGDKVVFTFGKPLFEKGEDGVMGHLSLKIEVKDVSDRVVSTYSCNFGARAAKSRDLLYAAMTFFSKEIRKAFEGDLKGYLLQ